jgi:two-component system, NtrC family, nitrogen regulation sensor histidine kinase NtrY
VNPRASQILAVALRPGEHIPRTSPLLAALGEAVDRFREARRTEAAHELEVEGRIVRLRLRRLRGSQGEQGAVLALEDVTSEIRTARVLAWGEMARQVAHEIKNPLTPIKLSAQHLRRAWADRRPDFDEIMERNVDAMLREIDRLGEISRAFARFGTPRQEVEEPEAVELRRTVEETLVLYRGSGDGLAYHTEFHPDLPPRVVARTGELKEVLVNLLENAREALNGGGSVRVQAAPLGDDRVALFVEDDGEGIAPELIGSVFEPHFSTRTSGTGLGLAIVRRLVESWGGEVDVESTPGVGTRFRIVLQVAE